MSAATERLTASVQANTAAVVALGASVDNAVAKITAPSTDDAVINAAADAVDASTSAVNAAAAKLDNANPPSA